MDALHGMGGIGKTVMARVLCDGPDIQAAFSDGILWTTLDQHVSEDNLKAKLREWVIGVMAFLSHLEHGWAGGNGFFAIK